MEVKFLKLAQAEFDDAVAFYYQELSESIRRCLVAKFPYAIIYHHDLDQNEILILAVGHLHRRPDYWTSRES